MPAVVCSYARSNLLPMLLAIVATIAMRVACADPSAVPAALEPIAGGGQLAVVNQAFPLTFAARVTDADGAPVAGVPVYFAVDQCISTDNGAVCPLPSAYPYFSDHLNSVVATTDANGVAATPTLTAGDLASYFQIFATVYSNGSSGDVVAHAFYEVRQLDASPGVPITAGFTGAWYDPAQSGHGLLVEVLPDNRLLAYWFAFTPDGTQQAWFGGVGTIVQNQAILYAHQGQGGRWVPEFDPALYTNPLWGTLTFTFSDCNHGRVDYFGNGNDSPWGGSYMDLTRLTEPAGLSCP